MHRVRTRPATRPGTAYFSGHLGAGPAMVHPTLLAAIATSHTPAWRARSVGIYRLWRDGGFAIGALLAGILADAISIPSSATPSPSPPLQASEQSSLPA